MTPAKTECTSAVLNFGHLAGRKIVCDFNGGSLSSDGGLLLIKQVDEHFGITQAFCECFTDHREPKRIKHSLESLVCQRVYGIVQGYEDLNDVRFVPTRKAES